MRSDFPTRTKTRFTFLIAALCLETLILPATERISAPTILRLWSTDPLIRVAADDPISGADTVHICAARGEREPIQIIVSARGADLTGIEACATSFVGPGQSSIDGVELFRVHPVPVTTSTPFAPLPPGLYPDALIPFVHPESGDPLAGARFDAVPFDLTDGSNQALWIEVFVPRDAPAGAYTSELLVTAAGGHSAAFPMSLTVWDFTLPSHPSLKSSFWMADYQMSLFYDLDWSTDAAELYRITRRYHDELLAHRLMPTRPVDVNPVFDNGQPRFDIPYPGLDTATGNIAHYVENGKMTVSNTSFWSWYPYNDPLGADRQEAQSYVGSLLQHFQTNGWEGLPYVYLFDLDEPNTAPAYQQVRDWGAFFDQVEATTGLSIPVLVTEHPTPDDPDWGSLVGAVDIWVPCCSTVWLSEDYLGNGVVADRIAAGDEVWWYTALAQMGPEWWLDHDYPDAIYGDNPPVWQIDYPPLNYRIAPWFAAHYGFTGLLYWHVAAWNADPWTDPGYHHSPGLTYNGEGQLFYPGRSDEIGFDAPVTSVRLKWLRDGMEDFEYIRMLHDLGHGAFAMDQLHAVARHMGDWEEDPALWSAARQALGIHLDALHPIFYDGFESGSSAAWSD